MARLGAKYDCFEQKKNKRKTKNKKETCQTIDFIAKCVQSSIKAITFGLKPGKLCQTIDIMVVNYS